MKHTPCSIAAMYRTKKNPKLFKKTKKTGVSDRINEADVKAARTAVNC